jgi:hypothetical protein
VTDAVAVGLNFDHVKFLNAAAIADMDPLCCSFHTNSPKIPECAPAEGRGPSSSIRRRSCQNRHHGGGKMDIFKIPTEWYFLNAFI